MIALYESAAQMQNSALTSMVKDNFDNTYHNISECFGELGLDNTLVLPSYVVDVSLLYAKIKESSWRQVRWRFDEL